MKKEFSNFTSSFIELEGKVWPTVEHFYQAMKTACPQEQENIRQLLTPGKAKRAGGKVTLRLGWETMKETVMMQALREKFKIPKYKAALIESEGEIVEWNRWHDNEWGSCTCSKHEETLGCNKLGKLLMQLRTEIKESE